MIPHWLQTFDAVDWVVANVILAYIAFVLLIFVIGYYVLFDPKSTTAGRFIFRFAVSLVLIVGLTFVGLFVDPKHDEMWFQYPVEIAWWRPFVRLIGFGYAAFAVTSLTILLGYRKWAPSKLRTAKDLEILKLRHSYNYDLTPKNEEENLDKENS
jgi:hypothetical protein